MPSGGEDLGHFRISSPEAGPADLWRAEAGRKAAFGNARSFQACGKAGVEELMLGRWFCGINLEFRSAPPVVVLQDYPSAKNQPDVAAADLDRLASLGKILWSEKDCFLRDLTV